MVAGRVVKRMGSMIDADEIRRLQHAWTAEWHGGGEAQSASSGGLLPMVRENHRANFDLWHEEDKARDPGATEAEIAGVKRAIDRLNQRRNDLVEAMDERLLEAAPAMAEGAPLHSETPGMMIDRMSILALKIFHTREQAERREASEEHRGRSGERLRVLEAQSEDLTGCLASLWAEVQAGTRRFRMYRQMKMYNDPQLNPAIYGSRRGRG